MKTNGLWHHIRASIAAASDENRILIIGILLVLLWHIVLGIVWFASIHLKTPRLEIYISEPGVSKAYIRQPINSAFTVYRQ